MSDRDEVEQLRRQVAALQSELARRDELIELLEQASDGLWDWDVETGDDHLSPRWKRSLGYEEGELSDRVETWIDLLAPGEYERAAAAVAAHFEHGTPYAIELNYRRKDGSLAQMLARGFAAKRDGKPVRMAGTHTEVARFVATHEQLILAHSELAETLRKRTAESERQAHLLSSILDAPGVGLIVADRDGKVTHFNAKAAELTGFAPDALPSALPTSAPPGVYEHDGTTPVEAAKMPLQRALAGEAVDDYE
ncbi:MAG: PAS domain-containing protein, partial [Myxococcota bacterium]